MKPDECWYFERVAGEKLVWNGFVQTLGEALDKLADLKDVRQLDDSIRVSAPSGATPEERDVFEINGCLGPEELVGYDEAAATLTSQNDA